VLLVAFSQGEWTKNVWGGCMILRAQDLREDRHGQGLTLVPISAQLQLTLPLSAKLKLTSSPMLPKLTHGCGPIVLKLSSTVSDVFPKVLKLSSEVGECKPLGTGA